MWLAIDHKVRKFYKRIKKIEDWNNRVLPQFDIFLGD